MTLLSDLASIATAIASVVIAAVALAFSYRQNRGWSPIAVLADATLSSTDFSISVEFWNRRPYPITLRSICLELPDIDGPLFRHLVVQQDQSHATSGSDLAIYSYNNRIVEPNERIIMLMQGSGHDCLHDAHFSGFQPFVTIEFLDPILAERHRLKATEWQFRSSAGL